MYKNRDRSNLSQDQDKKDMSFEEEQKSSEKKYLDIWDVIPSYIDTNIERGIRKIVFVIIILTFFSISLYIITTSITTSLILTAFLLVFFTVAFNLKHFHFRDIVNKIFQSFKVINPFENFTFWIAEDDPATLLIMNKEDVITIGTHIFKIEVLPENVQPTLNQFIKALYQARVPYTYQVVQNPIINIPLISPEAQDIHINPHQTKNYNNNNSYRISIYFSVYHVVKGILTRTRLRELMGQVQDYSMELKSNFSVNFHHTKIALLAGNDLINAIRSVVCEQSIKIDHGEDNYLMSKSQFLQIFPKTLLFIFIIGLTSFLLILLNVHVGFIIAIALILGFFLTTLWGRDLMFIISRSRFNHLKGLNLVDPFKKFRFLSVPNCLFILIHDHLLLAKKMFNLRTASRYPSEIYSDKFFRALISHKIPFVYNLNTIPVYGRLFSKECANYLNQNTVDALEGIVFITLDGENTRNVKYPKEEFYNWLDMRSGLWKTTLTLSTTSYKLSSRFEMEDFIELEKEVNRNSKIISKSFENNFSRFKLISLSKKLQISGFLSEVFKNNEFRLGGTHLNYLYFQGKRLIDLAKVVNEFKKGVETRIAAEFNTPLHLNNFITIGHTINTEFLEEEVPLGFTSEQIKQLLITNGAPYYREHAMMKVISELVKVDVPSIIFDYSGYWSKLIHYFENSQYYNNFLHFKLGSSFSIELQHSGIKYDKNNLSYLNLFYDVFALAFKEQKQNIDVLKETIQKNDEMDLTSITLNLQLKQKWEKTFASNSLLSLFKDFTNQGEIFSSNTLEHGEDINPIDFLKNDKTVIIDLSILRDLEKKTFITFVILAKFVHYLEDSEDFYKKIMVLPNVDMFFDSYYIDKSYNTANYGKIDKFIKPFLKKGFGFVFSANQIRYLHPHIFNYFPNIISLQATDPRDIAVLKNQMKLQELQGTGYYSSKRNNTYQIDYLMSMHDEEVLVKRFDNYQPFPGRLDFKNLHNTPPLTKEQIIAYMDRQGYKLKLAEKKILEKTKKTLFEKDFGIYADFIEEIINFLSALKTVDKIGNLYKSKVKSELLMYISVKASKKVQNKAQIKEIRDEIFDMIVKHSYLIEAHPNRASGSESMRTSYAVGSKYTDALQDYFSIKGDTLSDISVDAIEQNSENKSEMLDLFLEQDNKYIIDRQKFQKIINKQNSKMIRELFLIYEGIIGNEFEKSLKIGETLVRDFIINLHQSYLKISDIPTSELEKPEIFYEYLVDYKLIPFTINEMKVYYKKSKQIFSKRDDVEKRANDLYELLSDFYDKIYVNTLRISNIQDK